MRMWFGFNPAVNFCHFSTLLTLSVFAGATSTSPKFDLFCFVSFSTVDDSNVQLPPFQSRCRNSLSTICCTAGEVEILIKLLTPNKATGPDAISNRMLKVVAKEISFPLEILCNRSFFECKFPQIFKESNIIPLPKRGDNSCPSSFRPISLLSGVGKIQERVVLKKHA